MGRQNISTEFQLDVAGKFWQYMKDVDTMPETTVALRELYLNVYRPLLDLPPGQRVKFGSVLSCMKEAGLLSTLGESQETVVYQAKTVEQNWPSCSEGHVKEDSETSASNLNEELPTTKLKRRKKRRRKTGKKKNNNVSLDMTEMREMLETKRGRLIQDKGKVEIHPKSNKDGVIDLGAMNINEVKSLELDIRNFNNKKIPFGYVVLESAKDCNIDTTSYEVTVQRVGDVLDALGHVYIPVEISANNPGIFHVPLLFWFKCGNDKAFHIVKFIKAEILSNPESEIQPAVERRQENDSELHVPVPVADLRKEILSQRHHLAEDKENIAILPASNKDGVIDLGTIDVNEPKNFQLHIRNLSERKLFFGYVVLGSGSDFRVGVTNLEVMGEKDERELDGFECVPVALDISVKNPGIFQVVLAFWFKFGEGTPFQIIKFIKAELTDNLVKELQSVSPYVRPKPSSKISKAKSKLIPGEPPFKKTMGLSRNLNAYEIPGALENHAKNRSLVDYLTRLFDGDLTAQNHRSRFSNLLHVEEMQMEKDIQRYNMEKVKLRKVSRQHLALAVPGLAENRPSLVRGDRLFVRKLKPDGTEEDDEYEGFVHRVELEEVHLRFCSRFHERFVTNMSFSVRFTFSRTPLKLMHRAIEMPSEFLSQLPSVRDPQVCGKREVKRLRFYDPNIANNDEQKQAVENIVFGTSRPYPYLVFGPPGTGKTVTMVESIKQVLKNFPKAKVLACAPSNSAADLILQRVSQHNPVPNAQMVRLNAYGRAASSIMDPKLMKFCTRSSDGCFCFPSKEVIREKYRLVVTTLTSAGRLVSMGFGNSHFTHVFIDEAGHGLEPECLIPIAGLYKADRKEGGQLVLAGDPKQLGPVLRSPEAIQFGLSKSLLERLMEPQFPCFNRRPGDESDKVGRYDERFVTKLLNNYRSHPAIIKLPNDMFYDNDLRACANQLLRESLCQWNGLRKKGFPVVFEGVCGKDQREGTSPSFFNPQEVSVVLRYVKDLKEGMGVSVKIEDNQIGIISPYHRQVQKIRKSLETKKYNIRDIKVGSVEEFQGQERTVIIISTVRSSEKFLHIDATFKLGFLRNPKRFNVAITRAKALLIVVGNPQVLCRDEHWRRFIQYCMDNGSYKGCAFQMPEIDDENLAAQLADLGLDSEGALRGDNVLLTHTHFEDQAWRPGEE